jgi:hypothetical protein
MEDNLNNAEEDMDDFDDDEEDEDANLGWRRHYGNHLVCFVVAGDPLFTIGPHCKLRF